MRLPHGAWTLELVGPRGLHYASTVRYWWRSSAALAAGRLALALGDGWSVEVVRSKP